MVGIIVINYNTWNKTKKCIDSILSVDSSFKIIIVDNASSNSSKEKLMAYYNNIDNIYFVLSETNRGYAAGLNLGAIKAIELGCSYIVCSNNDLIYNSMTIKNLKKHLDKDSNIGICGAKLVGVDGKSQISATKLEPKYFNRLISIFKNVQLPRYKREQRRLLHCKEAEEVFLVNGACFILRANDYLSIKGFDENTFLYCEERIISYRMKKINKKVLYCPDSYVIHEHSATIGGVTPFSEIEFMKSNIYAVKKYESYSRFMIELMCFSFKIKFFLKCIYKKEYRSSLKMLSMIKI